MKKIIITATPQQHAALKDSAKAANRGLAMHTLHCALQESDVSKRLAALLKRKQPVATSPISIRKGDGV